MIKMSKIMEAIWLTLSFVCLLLGVYATYKEGFTKSYMFFVLTLASLLMYVIRRLRRKRFEENQ